MSKLPPHNQRRLNAKIKSSGYTGTWFDIASKLQSEGCSYREIAEYFLNNYGFKISQITIRDWMLREQQPTHQVV